MAPLVSVTDHAVERYLQRVRGTLDPRPEIAGRVARAWDDGRFEPGRGGAFDVRDGKLLFVVHHDRPRGELVVVTVWDTAEERFRTEGRRMGFMDKAKKLAEQAKEQAGPLQEKLENAQKQFNERQSGGQPAPSGPVTEYDSAGRPVGQAAPAPPPAAPLDEEKPHGDPLSAAPAPEASPGATASEPQVSTETKPHGDPADHLPRATAPGPEAAPPAQPSGQGEPEDRNKADYSPPGMSSGDPLAG